MSPLNRSRVFTSTHRSAREEWESFHPENEGSVRGYFLRPDLAPARSTHAGRARLSTLMVAFVLISVVASVFLAVRGRAAGTANTVDPTAQGSQLAANSLSWLSNANWKNAHAYANGTDVLSNIFASRTAMSLSAPAPTPPGTLLFWRTDGTAGGNWSSLFWSNPASGAGGTGWTSGDDAEFSANSTLTFASNTISNVTVDDGKTVTITAGGTLTLAGVRTFNIGTGSTLTWTGQSQSTAVGNEGAGILKDGAGILNLGAIPSNARYDGGFYLNAGTVIISGQNSLGLGSLTINGGTIQSSNGLTYPVTAPVIVNADFTLSGSGNDIWPQTISLGSQTRTITNGTTTSGATRTFSNTIFPAGGHPNVGLTFNGAGAANSSIVLSGGANTYTGDTIINAGTVSLGTTGSLASANIIIGGGGTFNISTRGGVTLNSGQGLQGSGTATTGTITTAASNGLTTAANSPLKFTAFNGTTAPLTISGGGTVTVASGNPVTVTTTSALGAGDYTLIAGSVAGVAPTSLTVNGSGLAANTVASLLISGNQLVLHVVAGSPPSISKTFNISPINVGFTAQLSIFVSNSNSSTALTGVGYTDALPAGLTVPDGSSSQCSGTLTVASNTITLAGATVPGGSTCTVSVNVTATTAGTFTNNTSNVTSGNGGTGNSASAQITVLEFTPPNISYTAFADTTSTSNRTLAVTVTDDTGVPTSGTGLPVIYFRKGSSGAYTSNQCSFVSGSSYSCVVNYSLVGGVALGNTFQYYVLAQDSSPTSNVASNPSTGANGFTSNPPSASTPTTAPNSYVITCPSSLTVNDTSDGADATAGDGICATAGSVCTLRAAIEEANALTSCGGPITINFSITSGVQTITLASVLPEITRPVIIDGTTQPGSSCTTAAGLKIQLDGTNAGASGPQAGLQLDSGASGSTIKGLVINRFGSYGMFVSSSNNTVQCNYIGTNVAGTSGLGNHNSGIRISGNSNLIGGTVAGNGNLISGNSSEGIRLAGTGNQIQGNYVGINAVGTAIIANGGGGVDINSSTNTTVGGTSAGARNVISGHAGGSFGISIQGSSTNTIVQGNYIGTDATGTSGLGNSRGVNVGTSATGSIIGGIGAGEANVIAFNSLEGVAVFAFGTTINNSVRGNSIFSNGGLGIDLNGDGLTGNDNKDPDTGPNNLQNFPVLTAPLVGATTVSGTLNSTVGATFTIDVYSNDSCDGSGNGEGKTYLGSTTTSATDSNGDVGFNVTVPAVVSGKPLTATATDANGNTSEFSVCATPIIPTETDVSVSGGNLVVTDTNGGNTADTLTISLVGGKVRVHDPNHTLNAGALATQVDPNTVDILPADISGNIHVDTLGGNDTLTLDFSGGNFMPSGGVNYDGGTQTSTPGDKLVITGGSQGTVTYNYTNAHDGSVAMSAYGTVNYTGLEPISNSGSATDVIFNLPPGTNPAALGDDGSSGNTMSRLSSPTPTFEQTDFANPTGSVTINRGSASDTLFVSDLPDLTSSLTIGSGANPFSTVTFNGAITLAANKNLSADAVGFINLGNAASDLSTSGTGTITLTATKSISSTTGASLSVVNGDLTLSANQQATTSTDFGGIFLNGCALTTSGTGKINVLGKGASTAGGGNQGIIVVGASTISSTSTAAGAGTITLNGIGGAGTTNNVGVEIEDAGTVITSVIGDISVTGLGKGTSTINFGVQMMNGPAVTSTGAARITIDGTGGPGTSSNTGTRIVELDTKVTSAGGDIHITGHGGAAIGSNNHGVSIAFGALVSATGGAKITIDGTAVGGVANSTGVIVAAASVTDDTKVTKILSDSGDIQMTGVGGPGNNLGNIGVNVTGSAVVAATGSANVTINGTGGISCSAGTDCYGVDFESGGVPGTAVTAVNGNINITGTARAATGLRQNGIRFEDSPMGSALAFTMATTGTGSVNLTGTGGHHDQSSPGIEFADDTALSSTGASNTFIADTMDIGNSNVSINMGANTLTLLQKTAGTLIDLGSATDVSSNTLELSDVELDQIACGTLNIGDSSSGAMRILAPITRSSATILKLTSGANIFFFNGSLNSAGGDVTLVPGSNVYPFTSGVDVTTSATKTLKLTSGTDLNIVIDTTTADSGYTQLNVAGLVDLNNANLALSGALTPAAGETFIIVNNDGSSDPITGTFNGLPQNTIIPNFLGSGFAAKIRYDGGDGNDVELTVLTADVSVSVSPSAVLEDGATNLSYTFTRSGITTGNLTVNFTVSGTADAADYTLTGAASYLAPSGTVTFTGTDTTAVVTVDPTTDTDNEPNETVILTVNAGSGYNTTVPTSAQGEITNDDAPATPGAALDFDGTNDYVQRASTFNPGTNDFTMETWIKPTGGAGGSIIAQDISSNAPSQFNLVYGGGPITFTFCNDAFDNCINLQSTSQAPLNTWTHVAFVRSGIHHYMYINGSLDASVDSPTVIDNQSGSGNGPNANKRFKIGARGPSGQAQTPFLGQIDDVRIWNRAVSCDEISQHKDCELTGTESDLLSYYKFDQGSAAGNNAGVTTAIDSGPAAQNGALNNFALTGSTSNWVAPGGVVTGTSCPAVVAPEIDVRGGVGPTSIPDGSTTPNATDGTDFGSVAVSSLVSHPFTIANTGTGPLTLTGGTFVQIVGSSDFTVNPQPSSPVAASGGTTTFTIIYAPTSAGPVTATVHIANSDCDEGDYDFVIKGCGTIACPPITVDPASLPTGVVGAAYSQTITASGGTAPYTFSVTSGALPDGLFLDGDGTLYGSPTTPGSFPFTVTATDAANVCTGSRAYTLVINACPSSLKISSTADTGDLTPGDGICDDGTGKCTLRAAIEEANALGGCNSPLSIEFCIPYSDPEHYYYGSNGTGNGVAAANVQPTGAATDDASLVNPDPDYPNSWWKIAPATPLPAIVVPVTINAYTQPGSRENCKHLNEGDDAILRIELNGTALSSGNGLDLENGAAGSTISGLVINHFAQGDIYLSDEGFDYITGNFIGTDVSGTLAQGSTGTGISIASGDTDTIGGDEPRDRNVISGHGSGSGVDICGAADNFIEGNYIGTDRNGLTALANKNGVVLRAQASWNVIGCEVLDGDNVISGNSNDGVLIKTSCFNSVQGNYIGTDRTGCAILPNVGNGVEVRDASDNHIGVVDFGNFGNVISGNGGDGVLIKETTPSANPKNNLVQGNFIGTNLAGNAAIPNAGAGVELDGSSGNTVGGSFCGEGNVISGNTGDGVKITNGASYTGVQGNFIGLKSDCIGFLGNGASGVEIASVPPIPPGARASRGVSNIQSEVPEAPASTNNLIGVPPQKKIQVDATRFAGRGSKLSSSTSQTSKVSTEAAAPLTASVSVNNTSAANVIAGNTLDGVRVVSDGDVNNAISQNSIYHNGQLGINLGNDGVTANDPGDVDDPGPNHLQNFPVITGAAVDSQTISGTLDSSGSGPYTIEFFTNYVCDGSYHGEGKTYLDSTTTSDGTFNFTPYTPFTDGQIITATATDSNGNTSEFSACYTATPIACPSLFTVTSLGDEDDAVPGDGHCDIDSGTLGDQCTLRAAIKEANALTSCSPITISATSQFGDINLATELPAINHDVIINGSGANLLRVQRSSASPFRIFTINTNRTVTISGLTIANGSASIGGGVYNNRGTLTIADCAISGNSATSSGGGIHNGGIGAGNAALTITGSTISGNTSAGSSSSGDGGGVYSDGGSGTASLTMVNSTVSGNTANNHVGGVYVISSTATLTNVTITNNRADNDTSGVGAAGGLSASTGIVTLHNTIVAGNFRGGAPGTFHDDINGAIVGSSSFNLIGDGTGMSGISDGPNNNQVGSSGSPIDPLLTPLANNGGPTMTHASLYNSPAIDKGDNAVTGGPLNLTTDQRGGSFNRQADGDLVAGAVVDVGAYERQATETRTLSNGSNAHADLADVRLTFASVPIARGDDQAGNGLTPEVTPHLASITVIDPALQPAPPPGYNVGIAVNPPLPAFDVDGTGYTGPVNLCFYLPTISNPSLFSSLKILHKEGSVLVDISTGQNFGDKVVCGTATTLSPFVIAQGPTPTAANANVSGQILDSNGNPVEGAGIRMSGTQNRLTVTDAQGNYHFDSVETNGFYTVIPTRANFSFSPAQRSFSALGQHTDAAFNATPAGNALNPLETSEYFVRQQYVDFLGREPDEAGLNFWYNNIESCGNDNNCRAAKRIDTSAAFFLSIEFQQTGYLVYRTYQAAYGDLPNAPVPVKLGEFTPDTAEIGHGVIVNKNGWETLLDNNKQAFMAEFVQRPRFAAAYPSTMTPDEFVDKLFLNAGVSPSANARATVVAEFAAAATSADAAARGRALRRVAENSTLERQEFNQAFVLMQYFGYLRRDANGRPDADFSGYNFWLDKLNAFDGNFGDAEMVKAFLVSGEYRGRFPR